LCVMQTAIFMSFTICCGSDRLQKPANIHGLELYR
jgi:hypothetical protein